MKLLTCCKALQIIKYLQEDKKMDLLKAAEDGDLESVQKIVTLNPDIIHLTDQDGYTGLHRASYNDHVSVVEELIKRGADVLRTTNDGWQPLHSAVHWNSFRSASILLQSGAKANATTNGGQSPLHLATNSQKSIESLMLLLWWPFTSHTLINLKGDTPSDIAKRTGKQQHTLMKTKKDFVNVI